MFVWYLAALVFGLGTILVQLFATHHFDSSHLGEIHDVAPLGEGHEAELGHAAGQGSGGLLPLVLSLRFWSFGALAFGLTGLLLGLLGIGSPWVVLLLASGMGFGSGWFASFAMRALFRAETQSGTEQTEVVGKLGRVLVTCTRSSRGKVRLELKGQTVDLVATTDEDELKVGESVLVEEVRGAELHVSRAPSELVGHTDSGRMF